MNVTKYPQSCVIVEKDGNKLLFDPGFFARQKYSANTFNDISAIILTHRHSDHVDEDFIKEILNLNQVSIIANEDVKEILGDVVTKVVNDGDAFEIAGFKIEALFLPHVKMVDDQVPPPNTGFIIDDKLLVPGDSIEIAPRNIPYVLIPIAGPDLSLRDARIFCEKINAQIAIPVHYSIFSDEKPEVAVSLISSALPNTKLYVLENQETITLS
jgi:L-ascorbate metabolism protein UlaG (beta-lactamase superfamily)